ncbi:MAG: CRTAC1 family protein [Granulosicoccus sp.]|nr:CRTAC1 family protein [Granulosicoccus sp.]
MNALAYAACVTLLCLLTSTAAAQDTAQDTAHDTSLDTAQNIAHDTSPVTSQDTARKAAYTGDIPVLIEEAQAAGIQHRYAGPWEYFVGGGVSTFDCNQDRLPDIYLAGGQAEAGLFINRSRTAGPLQFERSADTTLSLERVTGSYPLDIDNDGFQDLVILRVGENLLFRGGPDCRFSPANLSWNFDGGNAWSTAFSASFEADRHFPTLAIGNYVDRSAPGSPWGTCRANELHRPADTTERSTVPPDYSDPLPLSPGYCALSMLFTDWNKSGVDALRITNDRQYYRGGQEQLWQLDGGRYPRLFGSAEGWQPLVIWGMGIAEADLDADGYPEYALTSMGDTKLQVLDVRQAIEENRPSYEDMAWNRGATAHRPYTGDDLKPSTGWHAQFEDMNNDALLDLFITKGNVESMNDFARFDPDNLLLGTFDGSFSEQGLQSGVALNRRGRGASITDFNADGLLDIVVVNRGDNVSLFRNAGMAGPEGPRPGGNWLKIALVQNGANRNAIGARLSVKTGNHVQTRRLQVGGGHASGSAGFVHIGLGVGERATVRVQWPDGQWSAPFKLFANHHIIIERDRDTLIQWFPNATTQETVPAANPVSSPHTHGVAKHVSGN